MLDLTGDLTISPTTRYICPIHGEIGNEWAANTIKFEDGPLHCTFCLRDLLAKKLPVVEERKIDA